MTDWVDVISRLGFPIAAFGICAWFLKYVYDKSMTMFEKCLEKLGLLAEAVNTNSEAINSNTKTLADLVEEVRNNDKQRTCS